jgi:hypothetical protein
MRDLIMAGLVALVLFLGLAAPVAAGPLEVGQAAYQRHDYATAIQLWRPLADRGDAEAQFRIGLMYVFGTGVPQDYVAAVNWTRKAADRGNAEAQMHLGFMYEAGEGVRQDHAAALRWTRKALARGRLRQRPGCPTGLCGRTHVVQPVGGEWGTYWRRFSGLYRRVNDQGTDSRGAAARARMEAPQAS